MLTVRRHRINALRSTGSLTCAQHSAEPANRALPCLLMIPGTLCDARLFERQIRALRGVARVVVADYSRLKVRSAWLDNLLACLPERFAVAGFSLGGMFALELLRMAPERIDRLALIASNAQPAGRKHQHRGRQLRRLWQSHGPEHLFRLLQSGYFHHDAARRRHAPLVGRMAVDTPRQAALQQFAWAAQRPSGLDTLRDFMRPLLIASGALDRVCPPKLQRAMRDAQPRARWLQIPRCGHFVPLEAAVPLNGALVRWMHEPLTSQGVFT
ncbi:MAG: alpha/beta fold hydrolase [Burkholderiaceae bacterium]